MLTLPPSVRIHVALRPVDMRAQFDGLAGAVRQYIGLYSELSRENDRLRLRILELTRQVHGRSSEKIDPNALRKALEELRAQEFAQQGKDPSEAAPDEPAVSPPPPPKKPRKPHPGRAPLPPDLPREERRHALAATDRICECCQQRPWSRSRGGSTSAARIHSIKVLGDSVTPSRAKIFD